uniref:Uncharacterized protein n=1 Tax=Globisporangium ultimum (strain ATCC 200006 / CBS 805.95 / DAOM BR144) TaxID=431595 RepID=K3WX05_GLOUD
MTAQATSTSVPKKRKNDEMTDDAAMPPASPRGVQCSLCSFTAVDLAQSLTHLKEHHHSDKDSNSVSGSMDQALQVGQLLLAHHALASPQDPVSPPSGSSATSAAATSTTAALLADTRRQYARILTFFQSLQQQNARAATESLRQLFQDNLSLMSTLQDASTQALERAQQTAAQQQNKNLDASQRESGDADMAQDDGEETESETGRASIHEEEAAQALTGLRQLTPRVASAAAADHEKKLQSMNAAQAFAAQLSAGAGPMPPTQSQRPPIHHHSDLKSPRTFPGFQQQPQPMHASFGGNARSPLSITAPPPQSSLPGMTSPIFHQPVSTPSGSLPSLFSRPLLAPLSSPVPQHHHHPHSLHHAENGLYGQHQMLPTPTGMLNGAKQLAPPAVDWKSVATSESQPPHSSMNNSVNGASSSTLNPKLEPSPTSVTPVTTGYYRQQHFHQTTGGGHTSPVKRKSITSKQLMATPHTGPLGLPPSTAYAIIERNNHPVRKANPRRWTKEEDEALRHAVESHREKNWKAIAAEVPGRNHTQCLQRWTKVLAPGLVKGHWSPQEDDLLRRLVASEQKNWGEVAAKIPGRTSKQCRERWHNHLDPSIVRGAYTPEEDRIILEAQARLGNRWSVIAAMLPGRTEDAVKIRWKSHCRVWRARKYLRKSPSDHPGGTGRDRGRQGRRRQ